MNTNNDRHAVSVKDYIRMLDIISLHNKKHCKNNILYKIGILKNRNKLQIDTIRVNELDDRVMFRLHYC